MVDIEVVGKAALKVTKYAAEEVDQAARSAPTEDKDPGEQGARDVDRAMKTALRFGAKALSKGWGEITEDIDV